MLGVFSLLTLALRGESTLSVVVLLFSKFENQFLCLLIASLALILRSGLSGGCLLGLELLTLCLIITVSPCWPLLMFLKNSAVLDTELDLLS